VRIEVQLDDAHDLMDFDIVQLPDGFNFTDIQEGKIQGYDWYLDEDKKKNYEKWSAAYYNRDLQKNTLTFEFYPVSLSGTGDRPHRSYSQDSIKFKIRIKDGYVIGDDPIEAYAKITFDRNPPIPTDTAYTTCVKPKCSSESACCPKEITYLVWIIVGIILIVILQILILWCLCRRRK
jgi:hypothetical protein